MFFIWYSRINIEVLQELKLYLYKLYKILLSSDKLIFFSIRKQAAQ